MKKKFSKIFLLIIIFDYDKILMLVKKIVLTK